VKYSEFITRFPSTKPYKRGVMVKCPAHVDGSASLAITESPEGNILLKCFAGCSGESVVASMGLKLTDLFAEPRTAVGRALPSPLASIVKQPSSFADETPAVIEPPKVKPEIDVVYPYHDQNGVEVYQALRLKPKSFRQRHGKKGAWIWSMDGVERVLYRLPQVIAAQSVIVCEGEKDVDNLVELG